MRAGHARLSGAGITFRSSHHEPFGSRTHTHMWAVWAYWPSTAARVDGRQRRELMRKLSQRFCPCLNDVLGADATNEGLAAAFMELLSPSGAVLVEVFSQDDGLSAEVWAE